ncbi:MAG TPA: ATP-binding protein [Candidatus Cloacimonadota bacterium]|nr:ATP-binding protein [Candidatus Cloacimonadota bacterium]HQL14925.1 ATP-binding protein [Candidatus Cloacimonadota bacterium]
MLQRKIAVQIKNRLFQGKAIIITGPRQTGKTTLVNSLLEEFSGKYIIFNGDEADVREAFSNATSTALKALIGNKRIVFIDEAQRISEIGLCIKLLVDNYPDLQVIATGSSALDLNSKIKEPLTGRKYEFTLLPFSFSELAEHYGKLKEKRLIPHRLIWGSYPEVVIKEGQQREILRLLADSYLYRDLLLLDQIKKATLLEKITRALAFQVGREVSFTELGRLVGCDKETAEKYVTLLEKAFIVFRLPALKRNLRNEIKNNVKIYFYDNGILNSIIGNYNPIQSRSDAGFLWENYVIAERRKFILFNLKQMNSYFWRTTLQSEIDYVEEEGGSFGAYEIKWNNQKKYKFPMPFLENYPLRENKIINPDSFADWIS